MSWYQSFGLLELVFCLAFGLLYVAYIARVLYVAKAVGSPARTVFSKVILRSSYFILFIVALMGPSFGDSKKEVKSVGKDIFFCVDLSQSMDAFDVQPTRIEKVKFEMKNIVEAFSSDRMGIIMFSNEAFMQCPLTYDQSALNIFIETLNSGLVPNTGTDFGPPLRMALTKLNEEGSPATQQKSKIIILISDGEDFGEETAQIAQEIEDSGIKLFTLGVGTDKGSKILSRRGFKKDNQGNDVVTKLNTSALRELASKTGGKYFEINETKNEISKLINTIREIEGELRDARQVDVTANRYYYFLAIGLVLFALDYLISVKTIKI